MRTSTKVIIDKYAGSLIVSLLKVFAKVFFRKKNYPSTTPASIVVCKFLGMGSIVQSTPLLQTFKKHFPEVKIIYLSSVSNKRFLNQISVIDELILIDDNSLVSTIISTFSGIRSLVSKKADLFIDLETYSHFSKIFTILSGASIKLGLASPQSRKDDVYTSVFKLHKDRPVSESYLEMGAAFHTDSYISELYNFRKNESVIHQINERFSLASSYIIINPNASDLRIERRWPSEKFSELTAMIVEKFPEMKVILIGSSSESGYVNQVWSGINEKHRKNVVDTSGQLSIEELIALISETELMITNDTGPMHLAFAAHRPTIALFGPASPVQFGNHSAVTAIYKKVACSPCVHDHIKPPCQGNNICMKQIEVNEVYQAVEKKIRSSRTN